jgi:hypothetical protein
MRAVKDTKRSGLATTPMNAEELRRRFEGSIGDEYKVIEYHWLEMVKTKRLIGMKVDENTMRPAWIPFPVVKERATLERFAAANRIDWETVFEDDYEDIVHHVTTICPDLDPSLILEDGKSKIQCKGLPFFHFTVTRYGGKNKGIVASMLDVQRTIDQRESLVTELISKANGGADLADEGIFQDPKQQESFRKNKNKPGHTEFVDFSGLKNNPPIVSVRQNQYPSQVLDQINRMYQQVLPLVSRVSDSMSAITETGKSGVLFEKEYQVNRIGNLLMERGIKQFLNNFGEAYFFQYQISYAGEMREVTTRDKKRLFLNEPVALPGGGVGIKNSVEYTPRCRVIIDENKKSPTYQMRYRSIWAEVMQNINPEINPEQWMFAFTRFMETLDIGDEAMGELKMLNQMSLTKVQMKYIADVTTLHAQAKQSELTAVQAEQMLQQIMGVVTAPQQVPQGQPVQEQITEPGQMVTNEAQGNSTPELGI